MLITIIDQKQHRRGRLSGRRTSARRLAAMFTIDLVEARVRCRRLGFACPVCPERTPRNKPVFARGSEKKILSRITRKQREFTERIALFRPLINSKRIYGNVRGKE